MLHRQVDAWTCYGRARARSTYFASAITSSNSVTATRTGIVVRPISPQPRLIDPETGYVTNEACFSKVPSQWHELLTDIAVAYQEACGPGLVGVYLRGSLPKGHFVPHISDVDTFSLVLESSTSPVAAATSSGAVTSNGLASEQEAGRLQQAVLQQQQTALKQLTDELSRSYQHLKFTKVEARVLSIPANCSAAAALQQHLKQAAGPVPPSSISSSDGGATLDTSSTSSRNPRGNNSSSSRSSLPRFTPSMLPSIPAAFELKTQAVCLAGVDLPALLPAAAALPPVVQLLPGLAEDMAAAKDEAAAALLRGDMQRQVIATKWSLKRLLRCAFELVQAQSRVYTRDLYWCCHYAGQHLPKLKRQLQQSLELYVQLQQQQQVLHQRGDSGAGSLQWQQHEDLQQQIAAAWGVIDSLLPRVETLFLKQMLSEELGWLTKHIGHPVPATTTCSTSSTQCTVTGLPGEARSMQQQQQHHQQQQQWSWAAMQHSWQSFTSAAGLSSPITTASAAANAAGASDRANDSSTAQQVLGAVPPEVQIPVWGSVATADWGNEADRTAACTHIRSVLLSRVHDQGGAGRSESQVPGFSHHHHQQQLLQEQQLDVCAAAPFSSIGNNIGDRDSREDVNAVSWQSPQSELFGSQPQPVVLKGLASGWPAVSGPEAWGLDWLNKQGFTGRVRAAPSLQFPFVEPQLVQLLQQIAGSSAAPSLEYTMSAGEFVQRLQPGCQLPPLAYTPHELYYMQAQLTDELQQQLGLLDLLQHIRTASDRPSDQNASRSFTSANSTTFCKPHREAVSDVLISCTNSAVQDDVAAAVCSSTSALSSANSTASVNELPRPEPALQFSQAPRIWISPAGAVSPLHYDTSHSFLVQVRGYKRMLFFSPDQLYRLSCYPDTHLLRRRSRVNLCDPDFGKFPLVRGAGALEVVLGPGDCVFFPSVWAHYTESVGESLDSAVGCSVSVTFRLQTVPGG